MLLLTSSIQDLSFTQVLVAQPRHALSYVVNLLTNIRNFDYVLFYQDNAFLKLRWKLILKVQEH